MNTTALCLLFVSLILSPKIFAIEYETVVTDQNFKSSSRVVIDEEKIKQSNAPNLVSLIQTQGNIAVSTTPFQPNSIFIRGGDSSHVLFLLDGIPLYDATTLQRTFNLASIDLKSVRRIEIIKGSQTVLYGGQALAAVIKIDTIGSLKSSSLVDVSGGSHNAQNAQAKINRNLSETSQAFIRGFYSGKSNPSPVQNSEIHYPQRIKGGDVGYFFKDESEWLLKASIFSDISESPVTVNRFLNVDTRDFSIDNNQSLISTTYRNQTIPMAPKFSASYQKSNKRFHQPINEFSTTETLLEYSGHQFNTRFDLRLINSENFKLDSGLSFAYESLLYLKSNIKQVDSDTSTSGAYVKADVNTTENSLFTVGVRREYYQASQFADSYQIGYVFAEKFKFEHSTGFRNPSLSQLYGEYGNLDLKPEKSKNYSLTYDNVLSQQHRYSFTFFETHYSDLMVFVQGNPSKYFNISNSRTRGLEWNQQYQISQPYFLDFSFGYQEPYDLENNRWLLRRPLQTASLNLTYLFERGSLNYEIFYSGEKLDNTTAGVASLPSYQVSNVASRYRIDDSTQVYLRVSNLFNKKYEQTFSYYNEGLAILAGLEIKN
jgi:outer membrane cobalamin receptor